MKVLNVEMTLDAVDGGGCGERSFQMSRALARRGIHCSVLTLDLGLTEERLEGLRGVRVHALPCLSKRFSVPRASLKKLSDIVKDADIIHLMGHWSVINALIYPLARRYRKPYVHCPAGALPVYGRSKLLKRLYNCVIGQKILHNASRLIAVTPDEVAHFEPYGVDTAKIVVIPNGINPEDYQACDEDAFRRHYGLGRNPLILFVGRLNSIKGPDLLLRAFNSVQASMPGYRLVYAGPDHGMLEELRDMAREFGIKERVHFIGYVGGAMKSRALHAADLLVIPSRSEAMSIAVLEAGVTATPVLVTDKCGLNEIAEAGGGRVVPASAEGIRDGLLEMLSSPGALRPMGARLQRFVCERFIWDSIVSSYTELYSRILGRQGDSTRMKTTVSEAAIDMNQQGVRSDSERPRQFNL